MPFSRLGKVHLTFGNVDNKIERIHSESSRFVEKLSQKAADAYANTQVSKSKLLEKPGGEMEKAKT